MRQFPTLLMPLLASQLSAALLATMLARGQPHQGLGMGTAPGAGALGIDRPIPFRGLQPPSRPSPAPSSLPVGGQPLHPCAGLRGSASELLGCSDDQVEVLSAKASLSTCPPTFRPPGNPLAVGALDREVIFLLSDGAMEEWASPLSPGFYGRISVVPKASGGWRPVLDLSPHFGFARRSPESCAFMPGPEVST